MPAPDLFAGVFDVRTCRLCGCTDDHACPPMCSWVEEDLCSACTAAPDASEPQAPAARCAKDVGTRPSWMGEYQYDPCPCLLDAGHTGDCRCSHGITR